MQKTAGRKRPLSARRVDLGFAALSGAAALAAASSANATTYRYTQIDVPGATSTQLSDINDAGQIVGTADSNAYILSTGGTFTQIDVPGAVVAYPGGISNAGQIVGTFSTTQGTDMASSTPAGASSRSTCPAQRAVRSWMASTTRADRRDLW